MRILTILLNLFICTSAFGSLEHKVLVNLKCNNSKNFEAEEVRSEDGRQMHIHNLIVSSAQRAHIDVEDKIKIDIIQKETGDKLFSVAPSYQRVYCSTSTDSDCPKGNETFYFSFEVQGNVTECFFNIKKGERAISSIFSY